MLDYIILKLGYVRIFNILFLNTYDEGFLSKARQTCSNYNYGKYVDLVKVVFRCISLVPRIITL